MASLFRRLCGRRRSPCLSVLHSPGNVRIRFRVISAKNRVLPALVLLQPCSCRPVPSHCSTRARRLSSSSHAASSIGRAYAGARSGERSIESIETRSASEPLMAIVSLRDQRITVYDAKGWILRAPVSSGTKGRETPAGIFSIIQKVEDHYSNLYDDAYMPHMQRITWSGIALHG